MDLDRHTGYTIFRLGAIRIQNLLQLPGIHFGGKGQPQTAGTFFADQLQIVDRVGTDAQTARIVLVADLAADDDKLLRTQPRAALLVRLGAYRDLTLGRPATHHALPAEAPPRHPGARGA